jgi:hypothetical protein
MNDLLKRDVTAVERREVSSVRWQCDSAGTAA